MTYFPETRAALARLAFAYRDMRRQQRLYKKIHAAVEAFKALPPEAKRAMLDAQRESYVRGEFIMGDDATEARWRRAMADGDADEIKRLQAEQDAREAWWNENRGKML